MNSLHVLIIKAYPCDARPTTQPTLTPAPTPSSPFLRPLVMEAEVHTPNSSTFLHNQPIIE